MIYAGIAIAVVALGWFLFSRINKELVDDFQKVREKGLWAILACGVLLPSFGDTNRVVAHKTNEVQKVASRRELLENRLKQIDARIETLRAEDNARIAAHRLRTGKQLPPAHTRTIDTLKAQKRPIQSALVELDIAEGKTGKYKLPKRYAPN